MTTVSHNQIKFTGWKMLVHRLILCMHGQSVPKYYFLSCIKVIMFFTFCGHTFEFMVLSVFTFLMFFTHGSMMLAFAYKKRILDMQFRVKCSLRKQVKWLFVLILPLWRLFQKEPNNLWLYDFVCCKSSKIKYSHRLSG